MTHPDHSSAEHKGPAISAPDGSTAQPPDPVPAKAAWEPPRLFHIGANEAETGDGINIDGPNTLS
jgi:hypothetical protein